MEKLISEFSFGLFFWQLLIFVGLIFLLKKYAWKPILDAVNERETSIKDALHAADAARKEIEALKEDNQKVFKEARAEREASAAAAVPPLVLSSLPEELDVPAASAAVEPATLPALSVDLTTENTEVTPGNDASACASEQPKEGDDDKVDVDDNNEKQKPHEITFGAGVEMLHTSRYQTAATSDTSKTETERKSTLAKRYFWFIMCCAISPQKIIFIAELIL